MKNRIGKVLVTATGIMAVTATSVFAEGTADATVTAALTSASDNIVATCVGVAAAGIAVWFAPLGFRFAKKMFRTVAN